MVIAHAKCFCWTNFLSSNTQENVIGHEIKSKSRVRNLEVAVVNKSRSFYV